MLERSSLTAIAIAPSIRGPVWGTEGRAKRKRTIDIAPTIDSPKACRVQWIAQQAQRLRLLGDVGGGRMLKSHVGAKMRSVT
jgi:hypothetical protein